MREGAGPGMLKILVADDHEVVRNGICAIIESHPGWEVCAQAADGERALELALAERPDIAVLDVSLPTLGGIALTRRLRTELPNLKVLLFTMYDDDATVRNGLDAGARGYILKSDSGANLEAAIASLGRNRPYVSPTVSEALLDTEDQRASSVPGRFTGRELEIVQLIAQGAGNREIARTLDISIKTVDSHRTAAMRKSGCRTPAEFMRFAIKHNLVQA